jgi:hypothetical protein
MKILSYVLGLILATLSLIAIIDNKEYIYIIPFIIGIGLGVYGRYEMDNDNF